jgi:hypothetical protein
MSDEKNSRRGDVNLPRLHHDEPAGVHASFEPEKLGEGILSLVRHRTVWTFRAVGTLVSEEGAALPGAEPLVRWLHEQGHRIYALAPKQVQLPTELAAKVKLVGELPFYDLLDEIDAARGELVHVGRDRQEDVVAANRQGLFVVWVTPRPVSLERGMLGVESLDQLGRLLREGVAANP